jgi:predicted transcriptional regulator
MQKIWSMQKGLTEKIVKSLMGNNGRTIKEIAEELEVNRTFLSGYLEALESQGIVRSRKIGPAKVYFIS